MSHPPGTVPPPEPWCSLSGIIHPILARRNWIYIGAYRNDELWRDLQPALRFATQMLFNDVALLWWTHLLFGELAFTSCGQRRFLKRTEKSWNPAALKDVRSRLLNAVDGNIKFSFSGHLLPSQAYGETSYGRNVVLEVCHSLATEQRMPQITNFDPGQVALICCHLGFRDYFDSGHRTVEQDAKTSFLLGVTILHEIVHAVFALSQNEGIPEQRRCHDLDEPQFSEADALRDLQSGAKAELGFSLESYLFGMVFIAQMNPQHGAFKLRHYGTHIVPPNPRKLSVPTSIHSVLWFFKPEKWDRVRNRTIPHLAYQSQLDAMNYYIHYSHLPFGICCWIVYIPDAVLVDETDHLFTIREDTICIGHRDHPIETRMILPSFEDLPIAYPEILLRLQPQCPA
jgi:hypothetical protein